MSESLSLEELLRKNNIVCYIPHVAFLATLCEFGISLWIEHKGKYSLEYFKKANLDLNKISFNDAYVMCKDFYKTLNDSFLSGSTFYKECKVK